MTWASVGEWAYIVIFCLSYALIANIESRLFPAESLGVAQRAWAMDKVNRLERERQYKNCEKAAASSTMTGTAIVWYYNQETYQYWCGFLILEEISMERVAELRPHITVLNTDRRVTNESNQHTSEPENISKFKRR